ncbi:MAG: YdeI/OmpD-associated family protein [Bacteriovoracaceae bacterium]|nr:YdeI/OmpD-associated family protein [Bacteroidota bacterium]
MIAYIAEAAALNVQGSTIKKDSSTKKKKDINVPKVFLFVLKKNTKAFAVFKGFSYSQHKDDVPWIVEAKTEMTRIARLSTAVEWMAEGKVRNWKYVKK